MSGISRRSLLGAGAGALAATAVIGGTPAFAEQSVTGWVRSTIAHMTLEQKIGQLMVQEVYGLDPHVGHSANLSQYGTAKGVDVVREFALGGIIYFAWTGSYDGGPEGVAALSNAMQEASLAGSGSKKIRVPLQIATDQEQGLVTRFGPPATQFPGAMALGATRSTDDAFRAAEVTGQELRAVGINVNFAPVADVNVNPDNPVIGVRSSGSDPALVSEIVRAQVMGYQGPGMVSSSAKHFPGHGDTGTDSHIALPLITHTREEWEELDAPPFRAAIEVGIDMIMTAHILFPAFDDSGDPATLSKPILTGLLREELGYDGVIITDALNMAAVREKYGDGEVAVRALEAGADQLLMSPAPLVARAAILDAVASGRLSEKDLEAKAERVMRMKWRRGVVEQPMCNPSLIPTIVGIPEHLAVADEVTDHSITLVENDGSLPMPVSGKSVLVTGWGQGTTQNVADALTDAGADVTRIYTASNPSAALIESARVAAESADLVVDLTWNVSEGSQQIALVDALMSTGTPVVTVAVRNPYDVAYYSASAEVCTYSYASVVPAALVRAISGETNPGGKLPVDVPEPGTDDIAYPFGHGLSY